jgi:hypothetical protein
MNHPIVLRIQTYNSLEQIEIPIVHKQVLRGITVGEREYESRNGHNVFSKIQSSCEDNRHQQKW